MRNKNLRKIAVLALMLMIVIVQSGLTFAGRTKPTPPPIISNLIITTPDYMEFNLLENEPPRTFTVSATLKNDMTTSWTATRSNGETLDAPTVSTKTIFTKRNKTYVQEAVFTFIPKDITEPQDYIYTITATNTNPLFPIDTDSITVTFQVSPVIDKFIYVALGDSIPSGVSYSGTNRRIITSYTDMLAVDFDDGNSDFEYVDYSVSGHDSSELLLRLDETVVQSTIREADVITLCIGANDLMDAAIQWEFFGYVDYDFYNIDWIKADAGRAKFESNWPVIINKIKDLNSNVKLLVSTIYNPYNKTIDPMLMHDPVDAYMWNNDLSKLGINTIIMKYSTTLNYKVVDVHKFFEEIYGDNKGAVTGFYDNTPFDPHPDEAGQTAIYEQHLLLIQ